MAETTYSVTLHHLAPDLKAAGLAYPDEQVPAATPAQLRDLLASLRELARQLTIYEPSTPEIRIKTEREVFIVRTRHRQLHFVGWETALRGQDHSVSFILATVAGLAEPARNSAPAERTVSLSPFARSVAATAAAPEKRGFVPKWVKIVTLAGLIVACNATAAWLLTRPPPNLVPKYVLLPESESRALLAKVAGEYATGAQEGDRHLVITPEGSLRLAKYGPQKALVEEITKSARGAIVDGRAALITSDPGMLTIPDATTVILYGNKYHRQAP
jgi:hypothetical protein